MHRPSVRLTAACTTVAVLATACGQQVANPCDQAPWIGTRAHLLSNAGAPSAFSLGFDGSVREAKLQTLKPASQLWTGATDPTGRSGATWEQFGDHRLVLRRGSRAVVIARDVSSPPVWRPDGLAIAFGQATSRAARLRIADAAHGWRPRELTIALCSLGGPAWSPDGRMLALVSPLDARHCERGAELILVDAATGGIVGRHPTHGQVPRQPTWSADGSYASEAPVVYPTGIAIVPRSRAFGEARTIAHCTSSWWAPRGARLVAACDDHLVTLDVLTGARTDFDTPVIGPQLGPVWSTDGRRLALVSEGAIVIAAISGHATLVQFGGCLAVSVQRFTRDGRRVVVAANRAPPGD